MSDRSTVPPVPPDAEAPHWTARHGKPIIFVILTMVALGVYLALTIPVPQPGADGGTMKAGSPPKTPTGKDCN